MTALEYVKERKIVAIVRGLKPEYMVRLAHAFEEGGIGLMEVTYNQRAPETWADTAKAIEAVNPDVRFSVLSLAFASEYRYAKENDSDSSISS